MKKLLGIVLSAAMLLSMAACGSKNTDTDTDTKTGSEKKQLVVATSPDFPPFESLDGSDIVGIEPKLMQAIADKLGVSLKIVDMSFDNLLMSLANDEFDLVIAGLTADEERRKTTDFSDPYLEAKNLILVRAEDADKYASLDDLKARRPAPSPITTALPIAARRPRSALPRYRIWSWSWRPESWMLYFWTI